MMSGAQAGNIGCGVHIRMPDSLLGSQPATWLVLGMVLEEATTLLFFTWLLSFPTWGLKYMG
jgi:hypothetical protein